MIYRFVVLSIVLSLVVSALIYVAYNPPNTDFAEDLFKILELLVMGFAVAIGAEVGIQIKVSVRVSTSNTSGPTPASSVFFSKGKHDGRTHHKATILV